MREPATERNSHTIRKKPKEKKQKNNKKNKKNKYEIQRKAQNMKNKKKKKKKNNQNKKPTLSFGEIPGVRVRWGAVGQIAHGGSE